jgi:teichuronic acid biosynthesis glycosyltransferase TuaC
MTDASIRVLVVTNMWPRPDLPACGAMVVRQVDSLAEAGVVTDVWDIDGRLSSYVRTVAKVLALNAKRKQYDLVHGHSGHSGLLACLQVRYPLIITYYGYDVDPAVGYREAWRRKLERVAFRQIGAVIAQSIVQSARNLERLPRRSRVRATVIPNGIDRERFRPMPRHEARKGLAWGDEPVVLFAADPKRPVKRFDLAAAAVEEARRAVPDLRLVVCKDALPDDVPSWLNAADVLILTSATEGSPNVVKEAMACNLPIVSVDVGDVAAIVAGTRHCHVCDSDERELGAALVDVLRSMPERSDGRARTAYLDLAAIGRRVRAVYDDAIMRGPGPFGFFNRRSSSYEHDVLV